MDVPKRLYKYQSASMRSLTNLAAGKIWFSDPIGFNDPFDCALTVGESEVSLDAYKAKEEEILNAGAASAAEREAIQQVPYELRTKIIASVLRAKIAEGLGLIQGVSCFSGNCDDLLMWGHYGDGHRGFCLAFDTDKDKALFAKAKQVTYSETIKPLELDRIVRGDLKHMLELLLAKAICWEYEQEWRVFHSKKNTLFGYERSSLAKVIFGAKMPEGQQLMIAKLLHATTDTTFCQMQLEQTRFKLVSRDLEFTPLDYHTRTDSEQQ